MNDTSDIKHDDFIDDLLADFIDESEQLLARLNENLQSLDEQIASLSPGEVLEAQPDILDDMFRAAHSIKGLSAMLGLSDINQLTHKIENIFHAARQQQLAIDAAVVEIVFEGCDQLVDMIDALKQSETKPVSCDRLFDRIESLLKTAQVGVAQTLDADAIAQMTATTPTPDPAIETPVVETPAVETPAVKASDSETSSQPIADFLEGLVDEEVPTKYLAIFIDESEMSLDSMAEVLIDSESANSKDAAETLLITSHRIKGSAASVGLNRPARLAHFLEDVLQECRETGRALSPEVVDAMLKCTDALRTYIDELREGNPKSDSFNALAHELLDSFAKSKQSPDEVAATDDTDADDAETRNTPETKTPALTADDPASDTQQQAWDEKLRQQILSRVSPETQVIGGQVFFEADLALAGLKARLIYEKLANTGDILHCQPAADDLDDCDTLTCFTFALAGDFQLHAIREHLEISGVNRHCLETWQSGEQIPDDTSVACSTDKGVAQAPFPKSKPPRNDSAQSVPTQTNNTAAPATERRRASDNTARPAETLRVDIERLDQLMNLAGQLVINKARFARIGEGQRNAMVNKQTPHLVENACLTLDRIEKSTHLQSQQSASAKQFDSIRGDVRRLQNDLQAVHSDLQQLTELRTWMHDLFEAVHELGRVSDGIQKSVMDTRMVPIGPLFTRFKRVIRDITRTNSKEIDLQILGAKTELDKRMIDELGDPLIHMVRNSADHGVELPDDREAAGKPRRGTVTLDAFHRGNSIVVQVIDDGKGLHVDKILAKAIEKGIIDQADGARLTDHEIYQLVWEPGFSTAEQVTEISGRGMGMDIVRSKIEDLNGTVELDSTPGVGATFTIQLPLTLAILPSLLSKIDGDVFATPIESVLEIVRLESSELSTVHGTLTARVRDRTISVVDLKDLFQWNRQSHTASDDEKSDKTLVILGVEGQEIGLAVDELLGEEDIVIKSMAENYRNVYGLSGASILGDGSVSLILDPTALIEMAAKHSSTNTTNSLEHLV